MRGLVPATSPLKSLPEGTGPWTVHTKHFEEQVTGTSPKNSNWFEFVGLVSGTKIGPWDYIFKQKWPAHTMGFVPMTCCRGLVAGTSPLVCADFKETHPKWEMHPKWAKALILTSKTYMVNYECQLNSRNHAHQHVSFDMNSFLQHSWMGLLP